MPDLSYWERRQVEDAFETFTEAEAIADQISTLYFNASRQLSQEARGIFDRFRRKYGLSEEEARRLIGRLQDSTSLEQLRRMLRNTQQTDEIAALRREIESAAFRARLDRLQVMQNNLDLIMRQIYKRELKINTDFYTNLADKSYYRCMYRMQQRANAAFGFSHISQKVIDDVVSSRWSGKNFSARIWGNTTALANTLKEEMLVGLVTGRTLRDTAGVIAEKCSQSSNNARRLVRTESNYIHTQMNFKAYEEAGVEKYLYLATLDLRTSKICRSLDGEIFPVKDQKIGVNCPPMHPWCRSTTISIIDEDLLKTMQRSAIDPATGKRIKVPATMKYQEWYDKYVVGHDDEISSRQLPERNVDRQQFERYRERGIGPETYEEFRNVKYGDTERYKQLKRDFLLAGKYKDITDEVIKTSKPGVGSYSFDEETIENDRKTAQWLFNTFGGNIHVLKEQSDIGKMPDAIWNNKYWEFKAPTTKNAIDDRLRKANKQILEALIRDGDLDCERGILVDISDSVLENDIAVQEIIRRSIQRRKGPTTILVKKGEELLKAIQI